MFWSKLFKMATNLRRNTGTLINKNIWQDALKVLDTEW